MAHWAITWTACWSSIPPARQDAIETYLAEKVDNLQPGELAEAVEQLASSWDTKTHGNAPNIGLLIATIKAIRRRKAGFDTSEPYDYVQYKIKLRQMANRGLDRWNLICECAVALGSDWARRLERYAKQTGGFILPWWANALQHSDAVEQEDKPAGVNSWVDELKTVPPSLTDGYTNRMR